jgi:hypothetical protein
MLSCADFLKLKMHRVETRKIAFRKISVLHEVFRLAVGIFFGSLLLISPDLPSMHVARADRPNLDLTVDVSEREDDKHVTSSLICDADCSRPFFSSRRIATNSGTCSEYAFDLILAKTVFCAFRPVAFVSIKAGDHIHSFTSV